MKLDETTTTAEVEAEIINRGRGPEIKGTRITVFSILDYALECWPPERIADWFQITPQQVEAAIDYMRDHTIEVLTTYIQILERCARGNPPELQAKLDVSREQFRELVERIREVKAQADGDVRRMIREYRDARRGRNTDARDNGGQ